MDAEGPLPITDELVEKLCRAAAAGDPSATERLLEIYHRRFAGYAARKIGPDLRGKIDADDVLQEAYVEIFQRIGDLQYSHADSFYRFATFLIDRALIDRVRHLRRQKRDAARETTLPPVSSSRHDILLEKCCGDSTTPSRIARNAEAVSALMSAIAQLPEKDRAVVRRVYLNEEPLSAVASEMQCSENWIRQIGSRALERLGQKLRSGRRLFGE